MLSVGIGLIIIMLAVGGWFLMPMNKPQQLTDYPKICFQIAKDIEKLKSDYPQLVDFTAKKNLNSKTLKIEYDYHTHKAAQGPGWTTGVPSPDPDGVWFYIGLWDENDPMESGSQINTQPVTPVVHIGKKRITYLILEGKNIKPVNSRIISILQNNGIK